MTSILPPATIGILGGGQLGRMTALAARAMGYRIHILDPGENCAAAPVADHVTISSFDDVIAAERFARSCDVVTLEIEHIAPAVLGAVAEICPLRPGAAIVTMVQDRELQKTWLAKHDIPVGEFAIVSSAAETASTLDSLGGDVFLKSSRGGFDGRGQVRLRAPDASQRAFADVGGKRAVAERALSLDLELSVLVARRPSGDIVVYPPARNHHENQILAWSTIPADLEPAVASEARDIAHRIAELAELQGILAVEMFLVKGGRLLVNELAPRPHNSYHASELACPTSQFEQIVRAVCDLPLGVVEPLRPSAIVNIFGDSWLGGQPPRFDEALKIDGARLFLYGKEGARPARKMGHIGASGHDAASALAAAKQAFARL